MRAKLMPDEFIVGKPFHHDIYNEAGQRIFRKGFTINSDASRQRLMRMSLYAEIPDSPTSTTGPTKHQGMPISPPVPSPSAAAPRYRKVTSDFSYLTERSRPRLDDDIFLYLDYCVTREQQICESICKGSIDQCEAILGLADDISRLYQISPDACLAAVHIDYEHLPSSLQPVYMAILCLDFAKRQNFTPAVTRSLVCAALTADLGMFEHFDYHINRNARLSDEERTLIHKHPEISLRLLVENGVTDQLWHKIVLQHHEWIDGGGYPKKLLSDQICDEALLLGTIVWYLSMIMQRAYDKPLPPKYALQKIFQSIQHGSDKRPLALIKQLGIYPPGSLVQLANQEIAVVVERNPHQSLSPVVACIGQVGGKRYRTLKFRKTDSQRCSIVDACLPEEPIEIDLNEIWGRHIDYMAKSRNADFHD